MSFRTWTKVIPSRNGHYCPDLCPVSVASYTWSSLSTHHTVYCNWLHISPSPWPEFESLWNKNHVLFIAVASATGILTVMWQVFNKDLLNESQNRHWFWNHNTSDIVLALLLTSFDFSVNCDDCCLLLTSGSSATMDKSLFSTSVFMNS